jgi:hypothetical protein
MTDYLDLPGWTTTRIHRPAKKEVIARACRATFLQPLGGTEEARRMTTRCRTYIEEQSLLRQFTHVANDVGADEKTVRQIAMAHIAALNKKHKRYAPRVLGLDETKLDGTAATSGASAPTAIVESTRRRESDLMAFLHTNPNSQNNQLGRRDIFLLEKRLHA